MRSCAERVVATNDACSRRPSTATRTGPTESAAHATRSVIQTGIAAVRSIGLAEPDLAAMSHAALYENRLAVQRMPGIVNGYVLGVVGGM